MASKFLIVGFILVLFVGDLHAQETAAEFSQLGQQLVREKKYEEALGAFRRSERLEPRNPVTKTNISSALIQLGRFKEALEAISEATALAPEEGGFHLAKCRTAVLLDEREIAIAACRQAARLDPSSSDARASLLSVLRDAKSVDLQRELDEALRRFSNAQAVLEVAGEIYYEQRAYLRAAEFYELLIKIEPNEAYFFGMLAEIYSRIDREPEAVQMAKRALALNPNDLYANSCLGQLFLELGQNEEAAAAFSRIVSIDPKFRHAQYYLAASELRRGRYPEALAAAQSAAAIDSGDHSSHLQLGRILSDLARYEDAVGPYERAVQLDPKDLQSLVGLGLVLFESARFNEAISVLERANALSPGNETVTMFLRVSRSRQEWIPKIGGLIDTARSDPKDLSTRIKLIELLAFARRIDEAEPFIQEVWAIAPKETLPYSRIAVAYATAGRKDKALDAYRRGSAVKEDAGIFLGFASIYAQRGEIDKAAEYYEKVIAIQPNSPGIMKLYADLLRDNGRRREALEMYRRSLALKPLVPAVLYNAAILSIKLGEIDAAKHYQTTLRTVDAELAMMLERCIRLQLL